MGPAIAPLDRRNLERRSAALGIVGVKDNDVPVFLLKDRLASGPDPVLISRQHQSSTTLQHGFRVRIHIRPCDSARASNHRLVIAFSAPAAEVKGNKEVVRAIVADNKGGFDGLRVRRQIGPARPRIGDSRSAGQRIKLSILRIEFSGFGIDSAHLDPAPEASKGQPGAPPLIQDQVRIDGVEVIT